MALEKLNITLDTPRPKYMLAAMKVHTLQKDFQLDNLQAEQRLSIYPTPWKNRTPRINLQVQHIDKKQKNPWKILTGILSILEETYAQYIYIYTDGSTSQDTKRTAAAVVIPSQQVTIRQRLPDLTSIYTAELWATLQALKWIKEHLKLRNLIITDSLSVLKSMESGRSDSRKNLLQETLLILQELELNHILVEFMWGPSHINLPGNDRVDAEAKRGLQETEITPLAHSVQEIFSVIKESINQQWQHQWETSTKGRLLYQVQPEAIRGRSLQLHIPSREQRIINRLKTGKTLISTSHGQDNPAICHRCQVEDKMPHIFNKCPQYYF